MPAPLPAPHLPRPRPRRWLARVALGTLAGLAGSPGRTFAGGSPPAPPPAAGPEQITLQLKWVPQAQFAGYYVARAKGFYTDENLDVTLLPGGPDVVAEQRVASGQADFGVGWVASLLASRDQGLPLVDVGQIYQSSGLLLVSKKAAGIARPEDLRGKRVGVWYGGNEFEFLALMDKLKYDPDRDLDVVEQGVSMDPFLAGELDAASATTYNEYQLVLESGLAPEELNVINYTDEGVGMLEDNLFTTEDMVANKRDVVRRFVRASVKGWQTAVADEQFAVDTVMTYAEAGSTTPDHQARMMGEVAKLVVPQGWSADKIGVMDAQRFQQTADIALKFNVISRPADPARSYTNDFVGRRPSPPLDAAVGPVRRR
jgi:NitT/TauT family transport system substrate-binding protein